MNKKIKILTALSLFITLISNTFAWNFLWMQKEKTAKVLDNFKEYQSELLFENVPITSDEETGLFDSEAKINSLKDLLNRVNDSKNQIKDRKKFITKKKITLSNTIKELDIDIENTQIEITKTLQEISLKNQNIADFSKKINSLDSQINENKKSILEYLTYIYSKWDLVYSEDNNLDVIKSILLNDWNLSDIINDIHFKTLIELSGQNLIEVHRNLIKEFYYNKEELKKEKLESLKLKADLITKNKNLELQKEYKKNLLEITKWQEALFNNYILEKQTREDKVKDKIEELNNNYYDVFNNIWNKYNCNFNFSSGAVSENQTIDNNDSKDCKEIKQYFILEKKLRDTNEVDFNSSNPLNWPLEPVSWISTYYHDEYYFSELGSEHEAIDIPAPQGTDIVAPAVWYVYFILPPAPGKYWYIALKHPSGFVSIYGHISEVLVNRFDFIKPWMVFARSWWAPGTPGAWPMTSGAHLHFELYKDRASIDPLRFLDTARLNFDDLPVKYRYKYIEDLKLKYWNMVNMGKFKKFYIVWNSEIERQKYLLNKYATPSFNDWNMWIEEWVSAKIDPSLLICIWLAESGLGKNLKTAFNVWNVWNVDSGWTYEFANPREWIYWMTKTLNNKYLRKYQTIDMLSRRWNKTWSIYASSDKNWHNNVTKCLSSLKAKYIEDDFKFRINNWF